MNIIGPVFRPFCVLFSYSVDGAVICACYWCTYAKTTQSKKRPTSCYSIHYYYKSCCPGVAQRPKKCNPVDELSLTPSDKITKDFSTKYPSLTKLKNKMHLVFLMLHGNNNAWQFAEKPIRGDQERR
ncbi:uncharacterized protein LOC142589802 [Dermacentor variabilis]|uniref:uncharacterized protein LOC142589802 n=1 Tax=Dermacentor variabilis TaxID=34621 RepID=UPI003F5CA8AE